MGVAYRGSRERVAGGESGVQAEESGDDLEGLAETGESQAGKANG